VNGEIAKALSGVMHCAARDDALLIDLEWDAAAVPAGRERGACGLARDRASGLQRRVTRRCTSALANSRVSTARNALPMVNILSGGLLPRAGMDAQDFLAIPAAPASIADGRPHDRRVRAAASDEAQDGACRRCSPTKAV